ncbi:uncharacterized protein LOC141658451 [Silene latifolia]|uniref:uncharacterized protein LOC141658451 n=1 Tax=Silene latifolia TaxID=37657 RepID=UPI003D76DFFD
MGSLMAGWDSPSIDSKHETLMRNKSQTIERIEEYWKLRKRTEDEHLNAISPRTSETVGEVANKEYKRSNSLPIVDSKRGKIKPTKEVDVNVDVDAAELMRRKCWWTRSNWAFLNEPPVIESEVPRYKYASQHHVATLGPCN